jgi:hypothetical protein
MSDQDNLSVPQKKIIKLKKKSNSPIILCNLNDPIPPEVVKQSFDKLGREFWGEMERDLLSDGVTIDDIKEYFSKTPKEELQEMVNNALKKSFEKK